MSFDDLFIAIIVAGIGLSVACLCAAYWDRCKFEDAEKRRAANFRELYAHHLCLQENDIGASRGRGQQKVVETNSRGVPG